jgi:preprotein translocase subunit SecG
MWWSAGRRWVVAIFFIVCIICLSWAKHTRQRNVLSFFKVMYLVCRALNTARQSAFTVRATKNAR